MAYTKETALTDEIHVDGHDMSDAFRSFGLNDTMEQVDVSGFNSTGADEFIAGKRTQTFTGEVFYTKEVYGILWPIHNNRTAVTVAWKPDGLADPSRESFSGTCQLLEFSPTATRGDVRAFSVTFVASTSAGITSSASS